MVLVDRVLAGDRRAAARLASHIENNTDIGRTGLERLYPHTGDAHIVGITGAPGSGKSTLVNAIITAIRQSGRTVGVVAIDPTSPLSGGAALGDRIRMLDAWADDGVFIRSMASRGRHGGLAPAAAGLTQLLDAAGFDIVIVETVGVGQEEIDVAGHVHTVVVIQVPGLGDAVQAIKAGILEVADIFVVNKADRPDTDHVARELRALVGPLGARDAARWVTPILKTSAIDGSGVDKLAEAIDRHRAHLKDTSEWGQRVEAIARTEVRELLWRDICRRLDGETGSPELVERLIRDVAERALAPSGAVAQILARPAEMMAR